MGRKSADVDAYIANAAPFARPILETRRRADHQADPDIEETMKWSFPQVERHGIVGNMAAFKKATPPEEDRPGGGVIGEGKSRNGKYEREK